LRSDLSIRCPQTRHRLYRLEKAFLVLISCFVPHLAMSSETEQINPNIVIILVDDLGWNDVGYHNENVSTPNIDRLAKAGVELNRFYVNPTCSPTRASLMSGEFATTHGVDSPVQWHSKTGLPLKHRILPQFLKSEGYSTHLVGKWHLGSADRDYWPQRRGFDSFYGHLNGGIGYHDHIFSGGKDWQKDGVTIREKGYSTDLITRESINIIKSSSRTNPFFLTVSYNAPHTPIETRQTGEKAQKNRSTYLEMISTLDSGIGQILSALEDEGLLHETIIFFTSDNGGFSPAPWFVELLIPPMRDGLADNNPLLGGKGWPNEGGVRVPAAVWWAGKIESEQPNDQTMHVADLLPTLAELIGFDVGEIDGKSVLQPLIDGNLIERGPIIVANMGSEALIDWPWKLIRRASLPVLPDFMKSDSWFLFNLQQDPQEQIDLSDIEEERFNSMRDQLLSYPRHKEIELDTDHPWDTFGGEETREPWAEAAIN